MTTALKLYGTTDALLTVRTWIEEHADEIIAAGGEMPAELAALVDEAEGAFEEKVERVALYIRELLSTAKAVKEEADRLAARARHMERAADGLKGYLLAQLQRADVQKVAGQLVTVRRQKSPPSVRCAVEPAALFDRWGGLYVQRKETYTLDSKAIIAAYKAHGDDMIPVDVTVEQGEHVRIA
ncbi:MAG TPA: siphovirus Gp157 family protein [Gemmatimonadaceae bacterium]|nr:siphovirus Gp157 family protein [Gemmatimonadaceae bacterium]